MSLKVIGAGFGRTGTLSLKTALEQLGFKCHHMIEVYNNPKEIPLWQAAAEGQEIDWDSIFSKYQAAVDWPTARFYEELMKKYPHAKIILGVRNPEAWYKSAQETIYSVGKVSSKSVLRFLPTSKKMRNMANAVVWNGTFNGRFEDKEYALSVFNKHIEQVKAKVPKERLLVFSAEMGWEPLCKFLEVEQPTTPFPRVNDTAEFQSRLKIFKYTSQTFLLKFIFFFTLLYFLFRYFV
eukprot:TRINITY_DN716_c0_g1_i4.p1 TRINITY_DN716_c0_g1~~TRINITY_DN716_c0_g1_i4.p1  ORF type:complete len:237 (+),score=77.33 TRINITY_DN716_c0_g1_i4:161-871(+)